MKNLHRFDSALNKYFGKYALCLLLFGFANSPHADESRLLSLKGMSLGMSELVMHRLFPDLKCEESDAGLKVCTLEGKGVKELNVAGFETGGYRFDFSNDSLTALQIRLTNDAFDKVIEIFTQKYQAPNRVDKQPVENMYMQFENQIVTWKGGCNVALLVEKYTSNSETMVITLKRVSAGEAEKPSAGKAKPRSKR
ncbi:MAG: hypothetical protein EPN21_13580 [Methylococcaceae bacterium]|nr:MAG: hypothetical protein EPN21_13580 [Methylococcaceae bacterium]